jgi:hypothetical protein
MKYKLIKEYPFSPKLNSIVCTNALQANQEGLHFVGIDYVNKFIGEYFEEVEDEYRFLVFTRNRLFYNSFEVIEFKKPINTESYAAEKDFIRFFKTKADAYNFIIDNKPCLSLDDLFQLNHGNNDVLCIKYDKLERLVKERL